MDPRWKHPFPALVAGPTCCGKSQFVKRLLESDEDMIEGSPEFGVMVFTTLLTTRCKEIYPTLLLSKEFPVI